MGSNEVSYEGQRRVEHKEQAEHVVALHVVAAEKIDVTEQCREYETGKKELPKQYPPIRVMLALALVISVFKGVQNTHHFGSYDVTLADNLLSALHHRTELPDTGKSLVQRSVISTFIVGQVGLQIGIQVTFL